MVFWGHIIKIRLNAYEESSTAYIEFGYEDEANYFVKALDKTPFDYLLLCNKICGASHYNMQMKIVVDTPQEYKAWLAEKPTLVQQWKEANAPKPAETGTVVVDSTKVIAQVIK